MDLLNEAREIINEVDREMAKLFERRMRAAEMVAEYKKINGMPILDPIREEQVIQRNANMVEDETLRSYYIPFIRNNMQISRAYQRSILEGMRTVEPRALLPTLPQSDFSRLRHIFRFPILPLRIRRWRTATVRLRFCPSKTAPTARLGR